MPWLVGQVFPKGDYHIFQYANLSVFEQSHDNIVEIATGLTRPQAQQLADQKNGVPSGGGNGGSGGTGPVGGTGSPAGNRADLIQEALNSIGHAYGWGGAPGPAGLNPWDCSSCVNDNVGRVNGLAIPGYAPGTYDGTVHGPSTLGWLDAQGGIVGSIDRSQAEGGDLAVWRTHMGMFINNQEMVSAANAADGTIRSGVDGFIQGEQLVVLRLAHFGPGGITLPNPTIGGSAQLEAITRQIAKSDQNLVFKRMQAVRIGRRPF